MQKNEPADTSTYPTKRDAWLLVLLWGLTGFCAYISVTVHLEPVAPWMKIFATCFFAVFTLVCGALSILPYYTEYWLDSENLTIGVGPLRSKIPLSEITEVFPTRNPLSAPAWSLDRLHVRFRSSRFGALISPQRQQEFLLELARRAPNLELEGDRLG